MQSNSLRKLVKTQLDAVKSIGVKEVYFYEADADALFPHIVFSFGTVTTLPDDLNRQDGELFVDIWANNRLQADIENISDEVEKALHNKNLPQSDILPTFYLSRKGYVENEDKKIRHIQLRFMIQNYER